VQEHARDHTIDDLGQRSAMVYGRLAEKPNANQSVDENTAASGAKQPPDFLLSLLREAFTNTNLMHNQYYQHQEITELVADEIVKSSQVPYLELPWLPWWSKLTPGFERIQTLLRQPRSADVDRDSAGEH
jgi:hypothetical protein